MQESLPGLFRNIVSEAEFKQHGQTDPPYPDEKQLRPVQFGKLLPLHEKGPAEKGTGAKRCTDLVGAKLTYYGAVPFFSYRSVEDGHRHKEYPGENDTAKRE